MLLNGENANYSAPPHRRNIKVSRRCPCPFYASMFSQIRCPFLLLATNIIPSQPREPSSCSSLNENSQIVMKRRKVRRTPAVGSLLSGGSRIPRPPSATPVYRCARESFSALFIPVGCAGVHRTGGFLRLFCQTVDLLQIAFSSTQPHPRLVSRAFCLFGEASP